MTTKQATPRVWAYVRGLTKPEPAKEIAAALNAGSKLPLLSEYNVYIAVDRMRRRMGKDIIASESGGYMDGLYAAGMLSKERW